MRIVGWQVDSDDVVASSSKLRLDEMPVPRAAPGTVATIIGITLPVMENGTDPTQIPFAAIFAPVAAAMLSALAGAVANVFREGPAAG